LLILCLKTSYIIIEEATAAFSDSALPTMGIFISLSAKLSKLLDTPLDSLPIINKEKCLKSAFWINSLPCKEVEYTVAPFPSIF